MTFSLDQAQIYDTETFPNAIIWNAEALNSDASSTWEISQYRDDRLQLREWLNWLHCNQIPMFGFNTINFDYPILHAIWSNPNISYGELYAKAQAIITGGDRFAHTIWANDRLAPQIDLFKIHHFDNKAKTTSLKALQINMRLNNVIDMPVPFNVNLTQEQIDKKVLPYVKHDVGSTKAFAKVSMKAIEFRIGLLDQFGVDVLNFNDTKIGAKILEKRLGDDLCYDRSTGRKQTRQTVRHKIALNEIIFPYIQFHNPEFNRVLDFMRAQVLTPDDLEDSDAVIKTKGVFSGLTANVGNLNFHFGTGGIHGSISAQRLVATDEWLLRDIDVASLYPSIAIVNRLAPAHLGEVFTNEYATLPQERKKWQELKGKKCVEANSLKLAGNGTYGNSNNKFSPFYDPQFTMTITINGQLMLCMLAEWLTNVPTLQLIQVNTDGITYRIHKDHEPTAAAICKQWQDYTKLVLEDANYKRMWIRDVNNYIAEDMKGDLKQKGAYWHPDPLDYANSISEAQPPAWHKDLSAIVTIRAAVAAMVQGIDPATFIRAHSNPFDFICRVKADRASRLMLGDVQPQNTSRYYVAKNGAALNKISPPVGAQGEFKRRNGLTDREFNAIAATIAPGAHDERIHTKNKSRYEQRITGIQAGWKIAECNDIASFDFNNVNYDWYIQEAGKLII